MSLDVRDDGLRNLPHFCAILDGPHRGAKLSIRYQLRSECALASLTYEQVGSKLLDLGLYLFLICSSR